MHRMSWRSTTIVLRTFPAPTVSGIENNLMFANHPVHSNPCLLNFWYLPPNPTHLFQAPYYSGAESIYIHNLLFKIIISHISSSFKALVSKIVEIFAAMLQRFDVFLLVILCFTKHFQDVNQMPSIPLIFP